MEYLSMISYNSLDIIPRCTVVFVYVLFRGAPRPGRVSDINYLQLSRDSHSSPDDKRVFTPATGERASFPPRSLTMLHTENCLLHTRLTL